jgi:hypothetical protein
MGSALFAAILCLALVAEADQLTIGAPGDIGFCAPFGCNQDPGGGTRFQQVYDNQAFIDTGALALKITQIDFFLVGDPGAPPAENLTSGNYQISFSTTSVQIDVTDPVFDLDPIFDNNVGPDDQIFKTFSQTNGQAPGVLSFVADAPFIFDPTQGNLLLDVAALSPIISQFPFAFFDARDGKAIAEGLFSIMHDFGGSEFDGFGLVTQFHFLAVPEPSSFLLLGMGLLCVGLRARRGR